MLLLVAAIALLLSFCACGRHEYKNDVPLSALTDAAKSALPKDANYLSVDTSYLADYFQAPEYLLDGVILRADIGNNLDEVGIFHVTGGNAGAMKQKLEDYLSRSYAQNKEWYDSYIPYETPKLRDADVEIMGDYVIYTVLSEQDSDRVEDAIENALEK